MTDEPTTNIALIPTSDPEALAAALMVLEGRVKRAREALDEWKAALLDHMDASHITTIRVGETLELRAVTDKTTKCLDNAGAADAIFMAVDGDMTAFAACLSSTALLPGACRKVLDPGIFSALFETTTRVKLEGKPLRKLVAVNPQLMGALGHE